MMTLRKLKLHLKERAKYFTEVHPRHKSSPTYLFLKADPSSDDVKRHHGPLVLDYVLYDIGMAVGEWLEANPKALNGTVLQGYADQIRMQWRKQEYAELAFDLVQLLDVHGFDVEGRSDELDTHSRFRLALEAVLESGKHMVQHRTDEDEEIEFDVDTGVLRIPGDEYVFKNHKQRIIVECLVAARRMHRGPVGVNRLLQVLDRPDDRTLRISHIFRDRSINGHKGKHRAWGSIIQKVGNGYELVIPSAE